MRRQGDMPAREREREEMFDHDICLLGSNVMSKCASLIQNPAKFNIDTKNDGLENVFPFKLCSRDASTGL